MGPVLYGIRFVWGTQRCGRGGIGRYARRGYHARGISDSKVADLASLRELKNLSELDVGPDHSAALAAVELVIKTPAQWRNVIESVIKHLLGIFDVAIEDGGKDLLTKEKWPNKANF